MAILKSAVVLGNANINGTARILSNLTLDAGIISSTNASDTKFWNTNGGIKTATEIVNATGLLSNYVKLDAGAAEQTIKNSIGSMTNGSIDIWRAVDNGYAMIGFANGASKTRLGWLGFTGSANTPTFRNTSGTDYSLLHAGNYSSYALSLSGGTMSTTSGVVTNLDADKLDGTHKADLLTAASLSADGDNTKVSVTVGGTEKTGSVTVPYASKAGQWKTAITVSIAGSVTGSASINGSGNVTITTSTNHTHSYLPLSGGTMTGNITMSNSKTVTGLPTPTNTTDAATKGYVDGLVANATHYKGDFNANTGTITGGSDTLTSVAEKVGDMYVVSTAGTYAGTALEVGDSIIFKKAVAAGTAPTAADITFVEGTVSVSANNPTLAFGSTSTVGTVEGTALKVTMPSETTLSVTSSGGSGTTAVTGLSVSGHKITYTTVSFSLPTLIGSSAIGSTSRGIYWTGSAFASMSYTVEKSVPSNAVFTDYQVTTTTSASTIYLSGKTTTASNTGIEYLSHKVYMTDGTLNATTLSENGVALSAKYLLLSGGILTGGLTVPSLTVTGASSFSLAINGSILGNAASASRLLNGRTLTIGSTGKTFDGTANVSWSLAEIGAAASGHTHGNIANAGTIASSVSIANNDRLIIRDAGDGKIVSTSIVFDGSTTNSFLSKKGTWETAITSHQTVTNNAPTLAWDTTSTVGTIGGTALTVKMPSNPNTNTAQLQVSDTTNKKINTAESTANTILFVDGTNKFTVKDKNGTSFDVNITPSITNNITGSGSSGYIAKFNGTNSITNGPALGSDTTKWLRNDGQWINPNTDYQVTTTTSSSTIYLSGKTTTASNTGQEYLNSKVYATDGALAATSINVTNATVSGTATVSKAVITTATVTGAIVSTASIGTASITVINGVTVGSSPKFTDLKVLHSESTTDSYRAFLLSYNTGTASGTVASATELVYYSTKLRVQPSSGNIITKGTVKLEAASSTSGGTMTYDATEECIKFTFA